MNSKYTEDSNDLTIQRMGDDDIQADDLLMVTEPVASYLCSAGVKWEMTLDFLSGLLTETVRVRERLEGEAGREGGALPRPIAGTGARGRAGAGAGGALTVNVLTGEVEKEDCSDSLLMVTLPVASYLCSAGRKCEMTLDFLSGDLTETVRVRAKLEAREAAARAASAALRAAVADASVFVDTNTAREGVVDCRVEPPPNVTPAVAS